MMEGDQRFSSYDFTPVIEAASHGHWPARDQVFVLLGATFVSNPQPTAPSIRAIALLPEQFDNRGVTLTGRFRGRNLFGDLPQGVAKSKWDFVLQSADGAIWVTGLRPKGKDFDLDPSAHVDTGKWLEVKGTVQRDGTAVWLAAESHPAHHRAHRRPGRSRGASVCPRSRRRRSSSARRSPTIPTFRSPARSASSSRAT